MFRFAFDPKRNIATSYPNFKQYKIKGKNKSSHNWLLRQLKDPYVEKAKVLNYRCRSAFKLLEMDNKYSLLQPGFCVLDCGAAPGSWTQIAVAKTNSIGKDATKRQGFVLAVDRLPMYPLEGAHMLGNVDLTTPDGLAKVREKLDGRLVDILLSDAAPNAIGVSEADHDAITQLVYSILRFGFEISKIGSGCLLKIWTGRRTEELIKDVSRFYGKVRRVKPPASRDDSAEEYILATGFKGLRTSST